MGRRMEKKGLIKIEDAREFISHLLAHKHSLIMLIPVIISFWVIEKWVFSFSNWVPLVIAVWATLQYGNYQRGIEVENLNKKWNRFMMNSSPVTPLEHCEWLNHLLSEIWPNFMNPKLCLRFRSMVEKRLKQRKSRLIERVHLQEFSLGSCPPLIGLQGTRWSTLSGQKVMRLGFEWDTSDLSILLLAKLAKPFYGTARIVINSIHIKGDIVVKPILEGRAVLYSFVTAPEVRIGVAFGSGGSQSLPATELPGVSSWLVKTFTDTITKRMVEPRRGCIALPPLDLHKTAVGGVIYVTVISASNISRSGFKGSPSRNQQGSFSNGSNSGDNASDKNFQTFVEIELEELTRKTEAKAGSNPSWNSTYNMVLHDITGNLRFNLYECSPGSVKYDYLASCEIKVRYVADDSTIFWAIGQDNGVIAKHAEFCGKEVEMVVPFEGVLSGELAVRLVLKEWQFSDGSHSLSNFHGGSLSSLNGSSNFPSKTGRKISITVLEGKDLISKDRSGKCDVYIKLQYGKSSQRTKTVDAVSCLWNQKFEFDELIGGEYLKLRCYSEDILSSDSIGSASINLEGIVEGSGRNIWIPLEKVSSGEIKLLIEAEKADDNEAGSGNGWIEIVVVEARDLVAADLRGTSDPYVRVQYADKKRRTKVMYKTLTPKWNQTFEFPDDGSQLELHVKDHNALLPTSSIGNCVVEYQRLPPNEMVDKWIPLQGVKKGEIRVRVNRNVPELLKRSSTDSESPFNKAHLISNQMKQMMIKLQALTVEGDLEGVSEAASEIESLEEEQEEYLIQLETEQMLLINKIKELGQEILNTPPTLSRRSSSRASQS